MTHAYVTKTRASVAHRRLIALLGCVAVAIPLSMAQAPKREQNRSTNMRDWNNVDDRANATIDFAKFMKDPKNAEIRKKCFDDPNEAKRQFASIGKFESIPESVQFKMYDATDPKRQDLVVMVFPSAKGNDSAEATDIWMAAWQPWVSLTGKPGPK